MYVQTPGISKRRLVNMFQMQFLSSNNRYLRENIAGPSVLYSISPFMFGLFCGFKTISHKFNMLQRIWGAKHLISGFWGRFANRGWFWLSKNDAQKSPVKIVRWEFIWHFDGDLLVLKIGIIWQSEKNTLTRLILNNSEDYVYVPLWTKSNFKKIMNIGGNISAIRYVSIFYFRHIKLKRNGLLKYYLLNSWFILSTFHLTWYTKSSEFWGTRPTHNHKSSQLTTNSHHFSRPCIICHNFVTILSQFCLNLV